MLGVLVLGTSALGNDSRAFLMSLLQSSAGRCLNFQTCHLL